MYIDYIKNIRCLVAIRNCFYVAMIVALYYCIVPSKGISWFLFVAVLIAVSLELVAIITREITKKATEDEIRSQEQ